MTILDSVRQMGEADTKALAGLIKREARKGVKVCEIGSWKGGSTEVIGQIVKQCGGLLYCVDHWCGSPGTGLLEEAQREDMFQLFRENIRQCGLEDTVKSLVMTSYEAAIIMAAQLFDVVFIDADHRYSQIGADIIAWLPKVRDGGLLAGHDCEAHFSNLPNDAQRDIRDCCEADMIGVYHGGVILALHELFNDNFEIHLPSKIWSKRIR